MDHDNEKGSRLHRFACVVVGKKHISQMVVFHGDEYHGTIRKKINQKNKSKFFIGQFWETSTFDGTHVPKQLVINYKSETNLAFFWNLSLEAL